MCAVLCLLFLRMWWERYENHDQDRKKKEFVKTQKILQEFGMKPDVWSFADKLVDGLMTTKADVAKTEERFSGFTESCAKSMAEKTLHSFMDTGEKSLVLNPKAFLKV